MPKVYTQLGKPNQSLKSKAVHLSKILWVIKHIPFLAHRFPLYYRGGGGGSIPHLKTHLGVIHYTYIQIYVKLAKIKKNNILNLKLNF